jgi:tetratricopeptide (TPR) repeat protein
MESAMRSHLGIALREGGRQREAVEALRRAIALDAHGGSLHGLAFALVHLAHTLVASGERDEARALLDRAHEVARRVQNPRCQAWAAWGRARLALAEGNPGLALEECRRAVDLLQDREFPWALIQLWAFVAETATAAGEHDMAEQARARARRAVVTSF